MEALVLSLCITSSFFFVVNGRHNHHHHHEHHHLSNQSIALPPDSDPPSESPEYPANTTSIPPPPPPRNSSNSTYITPLPSPPPSPNSSNSTYITPLPSHPPSPNSSNWTYNSSSILPSPAPAPSPTNAPSNLGTVFNVRSFGAVGNGTFDDTEAFRTAWDSACEAGPAIILAPRGYTFMIRSTIFTGPCQGHIVFCVDGTIVPPDGPEAWAANNSKRQWLVFYRTDGLMMQGSGVVDGRGEKWWNLPCKPHKVYFQENRLKNR